MGVVDQTCAVMGRSIVDNLCLVRDVLGDVERMDVGGVVVSSVGSGEGV